MSRWEYLALRLFLWLVQAEPRPRSCRLHRDCTEADLSLYGCGFRAHHCHDASCSCHLRRLHVVPDAEGEK